MMALLTFYQCLKKPLNRFNLVQKFLLIKILITIHVVQAILFKSLIEVKLIDDQNGSAEFRSIKIQYFLTTFEMMLLSFFLPLAFPFQEKVIVISYFFGIIY